MEAVGRFAEDFVEEIGSAVDDEVLLDEVRGGIYAAENFDDAEAVEGAVGVPDGVENFFHAVAGGGVAFLGGHSGAELAFEGADVAGAVDETAGANGQIEVAEILLGEFEAERFGFLLRGHGA